MISFKSFSVLLWSLAYVGASSMFSYEIQTEFHAIRRHLSAYIDDVNIVSVALPFLTTEEEQENLARLTAATTTNIERSMSHIRRLISARDPRFSLVLRHLSEILDVQLSGRVGMVNTERIIRQARGHLAFLDERMREPSVTSNNYKRSFLMRCAVMDFMTFLGEANTLSNESNEALVRLSRERDSLLADNQFSSISSLITGQNLVTSSGSNLFAVNYLWKMRRIETDGRVGGMLNPRLPSWTAFYGLRVENQSSLGAESSHRIVPDGQSLRRIAARGSSQQVATDGRTNAQRHDENMNIFAIISRLPFTQPLGLERPALRRNPFSVGTTQRLNLTDETFNCVICLENVQPGETIRRLPCGHAYHRLCVDRWTQVDGSCPLCRRVFR